MDRLGGQIEQELRRIGPAGTAGLASIVQAWPLVVGEENARRSWPARVARDGTLHVNAADSIWAFQLGMLGETILERLRAQLGEEAPPAVRFAAGAIPEPAREAQSRSPAAIVSPAPEDVARAVSAASSIADEELREMVARAAAASLARGRSEPRSDR